MQSCLVLSSQYFLSFPFPLLSGPRTSRQEYDYTKIRHIYIIVYFSGDLQGGSEFFLLIFFTSFLRPVVLSLRHFPRILFLNGFAKLSYFPSPRFSLAFLRTSSDLNTTRLIFKAPLLRFPFHLKGEEMLGIKLPLSNVSTYFFFPPRSNPNLLKANYP